MKTVKIRQATKQGFIECKVGGVCDLSYPTSKTRRGRVIDMGDISPTVTAEYIPDKIEDWKWDIDGETYQIRIRKLTPRECFRLMGFDDSDFEKAESVLSNSRLYKCAGNSIVVPVLEHIYAQMLE